MSTPGASGSRVLVVGAGGNIGSHLVPHLGRMKGISEVVLIDPGTYESSNLAGQDIIRADVGRRKVSVQARRLSRISPSLTVTPITATVEEVPAGCLRADVILACLDSRASRQTVNRCAWILGVPWIDAGVHADGLLAQVAVYVPRGSNSCLECAWHDGDYAAIEQTYPCAAGPAEPPVTGAPSSLGALAAALQAIECEKLLAGTFDAAAAGRRVLIDAASHRHYVTAVRRNGSCRMSGHEPWHISRFRHPLGEATVSDILHLGRSAAAAQMSWSVVGRRFVTKLTCPACAAGRPVLRLSGPHAPLGRCAACDGPLVVAGFDLRDCLRFDELWAVRSRSLAGMGLRPGDLFTVAGPGTSRHYVIDSGSSHAISTRENERR